MSMYVNIFIYTYIESGEECAERGGKSANPGVGQSGYTLDPES